MQARHIYICDFHKTRIQTARTKRRRKDSEDDSNETDTDQPEADLYQLQMNTLKRYKRFYKVSTRPNLNKAQLSDVSKTHTEKNLNLLFVPLVRYLLLSLREILKDEGKIVTKFYF